MDTLIDSFNLILSCIAQIKEEEESFMIIFAIAAVAAILLWVFASKYTQLWNRTYKNKPLHYILFTLAGIFTFFFVFAFYSLKFMEDIANYNVDSWSLSLKKNREWSENTFDKAYKEVIALGEEDLSNYGDGVKQRTTIPVSHESSKIKCSEVYSEAAYLNFKNIHPFLSKIVWTDASSPIKEIMGSMKKWFQANPGKLYDTENVIDIASENIKKGLKEKTPNAVYLSRTALTFVFLMFQLLAFGSVGYSAYKDLKIHT